jgi:hypothetical protein
MKNPLETLTRKPPLRWTLLRCCDIHPSVFHWNFRATSFLYIGIDKAHDYINSTDQSGQVRYLSRERTMTSIAVALAN